MNLGATVWPPAQQQQRGLGLFVPAVAWDMLAPAAAPPEVAPPAHFPGLLALQLSVSPHPLPQEAPGDQVWSSQLLEPHKQLWDPLPSHEASSSPESFLGLGAGADQQPPPTSPSPPLPQTPTAAATPWGIAVSSGASRCCVPPLPAC